LNNFVQELLNFLISSSRAPTSPFNTVTSVRNLIISYELCFDWFSASF